MIHKNFEKLVEYELLEFDDFIVVIGGVFVGKLGIMNMIHIGMVAEFMDLG